ncbi:hypothetical protein [Nocardiopsis sp. MG754419]|uniref:hypothetical protein n=1 Tax=Nocardiopsis sp. MG754419 TaxID=2259865 RepID=UPI001BAD2D4E|nr:hypothetical protein [Nocardiopsis sp. MG754419]MBR8743573.1 hypothetical protein [Nocardiopsis sp. MG754419]
MSTAAPSSTPPADPDPQLPEAFHYTPDEEKYVLQADALRHRQLRSALLYGSSRYWRRRQRVWPAVIGGLILTALVCGVIALIGAFDRQQEVNEQRGIGQFRDQSASIPVLDAPLLPDHH